MARSTARSMTEALVHEFARLTLKYSDLEEVERRAGEMYRNDPYFHACVDTAVATARRVFADYESRRNSGE